MSARDKAAEVLTETVRRLNVQELARKAIEDELIEWRDEGRSMPLRNNGCVVKYRDGSASDIIRFGPETAVVIGVGAIAAQVADALAEAGVLADEAHDGCVGYDLYEASQARAIEAERRRDEAREALARVEALADEWQGEARAHREAAIRDADIERDWIASEIEHRLTYLRRALRGDDA